MGLLGTLASRLDIIMSFFNMGLLGTMASHLDIIMRAGIMLYYPLYASVKAIESPSIIDVQQWLMYWISLSFVTLWELSFYKNLSWPQRMLFNPLVPLLVYVIKRMICMWLVPPMSNGAACIYQNYVRHCVKAIGSSGRRCFQLFFSSESSEPLKERSK